MRHAFLFIFAYIVLSLQCFAGMYDDPSSLLEERVSHGIPHISGGVGLEERAFLRQRADRYNLKLIFASDAGAYLTNVNVMIRGARGLKIIESKSNGPWFYVLLPQGYYEITAMHKGRRRLQRAWVGYGLRTFIFRWSV